MCLPQYDLSLELFSLHRPRQVERLNEPDAGWLTVAGRALIPFATALLVDIDFVLDYLGRVSPTTAARVWESSRYCVSSLCVPSIAFGGFFGHRGSACFKQLAARYL
jgi:hypothetical protein